MLALAGCRRSDAGDHKSAPGATATSRGPDPVLLRIPRQGGAVKAYIYPKLDSVVWSGTGMSIERVLGFDPEGGTLAIINGKGSPARIDLRLGDAAVASRVQLVSLSTANGADIYGIDPHGSLNRLTRVSDWMFSPPSPARAVFPQLDGSVVVVAQRTATEAVAWKLRPPVATLLDTVQLSVNLRGIRAQVGDRVYFATETGLTGIRSRDLSIVEPIPFSHTVIALAPTPSGDRLYVATEGDAAIAVVDRYTDKVESTIDLPGKASALRMDPLGRYVIVRPSQGDSAWVIAVATDKLIGSIPTNWTADLPAAAPDGAIATVGDRDVIFVDGETLQPIRTIAGGAKDYWYFMFWNGFRPRAHGLDQPVSFAGEGTDTTADTTGMAGSTPEGGVTPEGKTGAAPVPTTGADTTHRAVASGIRTPPPLPHPVAADSTARIRAPGAPPTPAPKPAAAQTFTVSFAALLTDAKAREIASGIIVNGVKARVVPSQRAGTTIYRVVLGPYPTRAAAEQVGQDSKRQFWVYPGEP